MLAHKMQSFSKKSKKLFLAKAENNQLKIIEKIYLKDAFSAVFCESSLN